VLYLSVSQRSAYKRCRWQWSWRYKRGLEMKTAAPALRFGTLCHLALEKRYPKGVKRGVHPAITFEQEYEKELVTQMRMGFRDDDGHWQEAGELGVAMMNGYVNRYGNDDEWRVLATEIRFEQPIYHNGEIIATAIGAIDGVWQHRSTKEIIFVDHKTAASISTKHLLMDDQAGQYVTFGADALIEKKILLPAQMPTQIMFNFLRKQKPTPDDRLDAQGRKLNLPTKAEIKQFGKDFPGSPSKVQPAPLFLRHTTFRGETNSDIIRRRVGQEAAEIIMAQAGKLSLIKSPGQFTCPMCAVSEICELHEIGQDWKAMARALMKKKSPHVTLEEAVEYEQSR
jgi:hypothetical protein